MTARGYRKLFTNWSRNPIIHYRWLSIGDPARPSIPWNSVILQRGKKCSAFCFEVANKNFSLTYDRRKIDREFIENHAGFVLVPCSPFSGERAPLNRRHTNRTLLSITLQLPYRYNRQFDLLLLV